MIPVLAAAAGLLLFQTVFVAMISAMRPQGNIYSTIIGVAIVTAPLAAIADQGLFGHRLDADARVCLALLHLVLGGFLFHFMTLPDRSVTLRLLVELMLAPGGALSLDALNARYGVRTMIGSRLDQLADGGFLTIAPDGSIALLPRGERFGRFVTAGRRLFRITSAN